MYLDLLEGLKRAQRFRLEDQRGTEINFELPDFLKDKNNRKSANSTSSDGPNARDEDGTYTKPPGKAPQPAPRFSISRSISHNNSIENSSFSEASNQNGDRNRGKNTVFSS